MPDIGETAPDFSLPNQDGKTITLSDFRGQKVIIFVFPKANTPGCTAQACGFRDVFPDVDADNAVVLGISADKQETLRAWKDKRNLPYDLLSDPAHEMLDAWGAYGNLFPIGGIKAPIRSFWVIDENGTIIAGQVKISPDKSVKQALAAIQ